MTDAENAYRKCEELFDPDRFLRLFDEQLEGKVASFRSDGLKELVSLAFLSSLHEEEGVRVRFRAVIPGGTLPPAVMQFETPKIVGVYELRKLALAIDPEQSRFVITRNGEGKWQIAGVSRPWERVLGLVADLWNSLELVVRGAGQLALVFSDRAAVYNRGEYVSMPSGEWLVRDHLPAGATDALLAYLGTPIRNRDVLQIQTSYCRRFDLDEQGWDRHRPMFEVVLKEWITTGLALGIGNLIAAARRRGRGAGMLFLGANNRYPADPSAKRTGMFFAPSEDGASDWNEGLTKWIAWNVQRTLAEKRVYILAVEEQFKKDFQRWIARVANGACHDAKEEWLSDVERCAQLTQLDGGVVFGPMLSPVAFNQTFTIPSDEERIGGGHRHKSMRAEVARHEGALGVVVSQDGQVTLMWREGTEVHADPIDFYI